MRALYSGHLILPDFITLSTLGNGNFSVIHLSYVHIFTSALVSQTLLIKILPSECRTKKVWEINGLKIKCLYKSPT